MPLSPIFTALEKTAPGAMQRPRALRLALAGFSVFLAALLRWGLDPLLGESTPWIFFYPAVLVAAWYGRLSAGLFAAFLSVMIAAASWLQYGTAAQAWTSALVFSVCAAAMSALGELWHRATASQLRAKQDLHSERTFLQSVLNSITDGFVVLDEQWRFRYVNDSALKIAARSREELEGKPAWEAFPNLAGTRLEQELKHAREQHQPAQFDISYPERGLWLEFRVYPMAGNTAVYIADISNRKRTELELASAREKLASHAANLEALVHERTARLEETVAELERFSYTISHDLRAPLRAMQGFSTFLMEDYGARLDDEGRDHLKRIQEAAKRMDALINDVLVYSRVSRSELPLGPVSLDQAVEEALASQQTAGTEVRVKGPLGKALGNQTLLGQAVANYITNALKFTRPGEGPRVEIWSERSGECIRLLVKDYGMGVPEAAQGKIFGMFERAHGNSYPGTGIGLAIVKRAVERMEGAVGFESKPGQGSTFWLELPAAN